MCVGKIKCKECRDVHGSLEKQAVGDVSQPAEGKPQKLNHEEWTYTTIIDRLHRAEEVK
jgi:hypothetical protein